MEAYDYQITIYSYIYIKNLTKYQLNFSIIFRATSKCINEINDF